jgi:hypothetical protein
MKSNNSTGGFTKIAFVAMQALDKRSFFDGAGRNITVVPKRRVTGYSHYHITIKAKSGLPTMAFNQQMEWTIRLAVLGEFPSSSFQR